MRTGIIIIFHNCEKLIDKAFFLDYISKATHVEICLVNNNSSDNTYELLKDISEYCKNASVLNINTLKTEISAIRAGARFLVNHSNFKNIGYINTNGIHSNSKELNRVLKTIIDNQENLMHYKYQVSQQKRIKVSEFQNIFSFLDCINVFNNDRKILSFQS